MPLHWWDTPEPGIANRLSARFCFHLARGAGFVRRRTCLGATPSVRSWTGKLWGQRTTLFADPDSAYAPISLVIPGGVSGRHGPQAWPGVISSAAIAAPSVRSDPRLQSGWESLGTVCRRPDGVRAKRKRKIGTSGCHGWAWAHLLCRFRGFAGHPYDAIATAYRAPTWISVAAGRLPTSWPYALPPMTWLPITVDAFV